jgi:hypothetical protein
MSNHFILLILEQHVKLRKIGIEHYKKRIRILSVRF